VSKAALRLISLDPDAIASIEADVLAFASERGLDTGAYAELIGEMARANAALPSRGGIDGEPWWGGYLAIERETALVVGMCAYKTPPRDGEVEIAYFTFPAFERRGIGSAMAALLVSTAAESSEVTMVIAHTLPELNPSGLILTCNNFTRAGEMIDPEDGLVWRWERAVSGA